jgi:hypothetical protein
MDQFHALLLKAFENRAISIENRSGEGWGVDLNPGDCHENVARWISVYGGARQKCWIRTGPVFGSHSIVRSSTGELLEITPMNDRSKASTIALFEHLPVDDFAESKYAYMIIP